MRQSRLVSFIEALANGMVGYGIAVLTQFVVFPLFELQISLGSNLAIGAVFTIVSFVRSYALRRAFKLIRPR